MEYFIWVIGVLFLLPIILIVIAAIKTEIDLYSPYYQSCPCCLVGRLQVKDFGSDLQFTETISPCSDCGYIEDELRGC